MLFVVQGQSPQAIHTEEVQKVHQCGEQRQARKHGWKALQQVVFAAQGVQLSQLRKLVGQVHQLVAAVAASA